MMPSLVAVGAFDQESLHVVVRFLAAETGPRHLYLVVICTRYSQIQNSEGPVEAGVVWLRQVEKT